MVQILQFIPKEFSTFGKAAASLPIPGLVDKLGDVKIKKVATECLSSFAESVGLGFVLSEGSIPMLIISAEL